MIRGDSVSGRGRKWPIDLLFNLEHPEHLLFVTEVNEEANDNEDLIEDEADSTEDELQRRFDKMTFVVSTRKLEQLPHLVKVSEVFKTDGYIHLTIYRCQSKSGGKVNLIPATL